MKLTNAASSIIIRVIRGYNTIYHTFVARKFSYKHSDIHTYYSKNKLQTYTVLGNKRSIHSDDTEDDELSNGIEDLYTEFYQQPARLVLDADLSDTLTRKLNDCSSLQDVLNFIINYENDLDAKHVTQIVLTLWNLQKMFYHVALSRSATYVNTSNFSKFNEDYITILKNDKIFERLVNLLRKKQNDFTVEEISNTLSYLNKMGFSIKEEAMQVLISQFKDKFTRTISLYTLARFMSAIYMKKDLSFYFNIQTFIPIIIDNIDRCNTAEELNAVTLCLNTINGVIIGDTLAQYKRKVTELLDSNKITFKEFTIILNIMMLLNFPHWRNNNMKLIIQCLSLLKGHLHLLNTNQLLIVYEVFEKIQEPGDMLYEIQRCASKFLLQMEEEMSPLLNIRLKLFSCIIYFASPLRRLKFKKIIENYVDHDLDGKSLHELYKIIVHTKTSKVDVCNKFWKKILSALEKENFQQQNLLQVCQNYISFTKHIQGYRCPEFEETMIKILDIELKHGLIGLLPSHVATIASFLLIYTNSYETLSMAVDRVTKFAEYFTPKECFHLSRCLHITQNKNKYLNMHTVLKMKKILDTCTYKLLEKDLTADEMNILLKSYIYRESEDKYLLQLLRKNCKSEILLNSTLVKNISYNLYATNTLLPEVMNNLVNYIIESKNNILGFNAETIVHLCYYLGYLPNNSEEFFKAVTDVFLRDQERMSGLSYLQACLSLCFFNHLPHSFIKQIFTVEFMEKLDIELANCYYKDVYPLRVRHYMMQLNRAVCLDYPQLNVPWFHKKYVVQLQEKDTQRSEMDQVLYLSVKECLGEVIKDKQSIKENERSPYGYHIDFAINSDIAANSDSSVQKLAVLVMKPNNFTNQLRQLKGYYQLKIKHLEILGYKVCLLDSVDWHNMLLTEEKLNYIRNILK